MQGLRNNLASVGVAEENRVRVQKIVDVGQAGVAVGYVYRSAAADLAGDPLRKRLLVFVGQAVPQIGRQFIGAELAAFSFGALFLLLNVEDAVVAKVRGGFVIQGVA